MLKKLVALLFILMSRLVFAQDGSKPYLPENFPTNKFEITFTESTFHNLILKFVSIKDRKPSLIGENECVVYLLIYKNYKLVENKVVGYNRGVSSFGIPKEQPLDNLFMFCSFGEWNGEMSVIDTTGKITTFPGFYWALSQDKTFIVTKANYPDSDLLVSKFEIGTGTYTTKNWHTGLNGEPWKELIPSDYKQADWLLCK